MNRFPSSRGAHSATWRSRKLDCFAALAMTALTGCSLAPDFVIPDTATPKAFKEIPAEAKGTWKEAAPMEAADRGQWWKIFGDGTLNGLEAQAEKSNQTLAAAAARVEQARALVRASASTLFPKLELGGNVVRSQPSSAGTAAFGGNPNAQLNPYTLYSAQGVATYEVDLFGRVRDGEKALKADAEAQNALYKSTLLALQADVANHYFNLRALDAERALLRNTVTMREEAMRIMHKRFDAGEAGETDLTRAKADLAAVQAELLALDQSRAVLEHALAVLLGESPSGFTFVESSLEDMPPQIPAGLPSSLLARRPDIAAAIQSMASANARIGVARTAFLPQLILTASGGAESLTLGDLFQWSSRTWALGQAGGLSMTLFDSGRTIARVDAADAAYRESVANYRQQVLVAFRDVEDTLSAQRLLAEQSMKIEEAATAATRATSLIQKRYDEGDVNYFEVVDAQRSSLTAQRAHVQTRGQRFLATVALIRALGGGWDTTETATAQSPSANP
jgi:multidrug efflux system outer membrane protein